MVNFFDRVLEYPGFYRQFMCSENLITVFNCPLEARLMTRQFADLYTEQNYLFYVVEGRKKWHTAGGSFDIGAGSCVFVRKGGFILEQVVDEGFCVVLFFIPDEFICETLRLKTKPLTEQSSVHSPLMFLHTNEAMKAFFNSMSSFFSETDEPDKALLELKFRELILTLAASPRNNELLSYFCALMHEPRPSSLHRIMHDNFCFNLSLEQFASLCNRSLSAFKRDFTKLYQTSPGKWILEARLNKARALLENTSKTVSEIAFESGFENAAHFSRSFKTKFGSSATKLRGLQSGLPGSEEQTA